MSNLSDHYVQSEFSRIASNESDFNSRLRRTYAQLRGSGVRHRIRRVAIELYEPVIALKAEEQKQLAHHEKVSATFVAAADAIDVDFAAEHPVELDESTEDDLAMARAKLASEVNRIIVQFGLTERQATRVVKLARRLFHSLPPEAV